MKRSEAVSIIMDTFDIDGLGELESETILKKLEEAGMLPPDTNPGCGDPECCGGPSHSWDEE